MSFRLKNSLKKNSYDTRRLPGGWPLVENLSIPVTYVYGLGEALVHCTSGPRITGSCGSRGN